MMQRIINRIQHRIRTFACVVVGGAHERGLHFTDHKSYIINLCAVFAALVVVLASSLSYAERTHAQFNEQINYQGKLTNSSGAAVADGTYNMRFYLYDQQGAATTSAIWTEELTGSDQVQVTNGLFSVMLGSTTPLASVDFNQTLYLGVEIGGSGAPSWDGEMSPRKIFGTVPAAFEAQRLDGLATTSFLRSDTDDTATGQITFTGTTTHATSTFDLASTTNLRVGGETVSELTGAGLFVSGGALTATITTSEIVDGTITESDLDITGSPTDGRVLQASSTASGGFVWTATSSLGLSEDLSDNSIEELSDVASMTKNFGNLLFWNGSAWADIATSSLSIGPSGLQATDFGDFSCNGTSCSIDTNTVETSNISDGTITEADLNLNSPTDGYVLQASSTSAGGFVWVATSTLGISAGSATLAELTDTDTTGANFGNLLMFDGSNWVDAATNTLSIALSDTTGTLDISDRTNLTVTATGLELSGDAIALSSGYEIPLSASTTNWNNFYDTPSTRITAGTNLDWSGNTLNASGLGDGTFLGLSDTISSYNANRILFTSGGGVVDSANFEFDDTTDTLTLGNLTLSDGLTTHTGVSTTTVPNNEAFAWTVATSSASMPLFRVDTRTGVEGITIGSGSGDLYLGAIGSASNLIFEESSTISGQGENTVTLGVSGDIFTIPAGVSFGIGTSSPSTPFAVNGGLFLSSTTPTTTTYSLYNQGGTLYFNGSEVGGISTVSESDLNISGSPTDGYVLQASSTSAGGFVWVATSTLGISAGSATLAELTDTDTTGANFGNLLMFDGSNWVDAATSTLSIGPSGLQATDFGDFSCNGTSCSIDNGAVAFEELSDVSSMTKDFGDLLYWNGSAWADIATTSLGLLADADDSISPDNILSTGKTDEYCLTYESTGDTFEWAECGSGGASDFLSLSDTPDAYTANRVFFTNAAGTAVADDADFTFATSTDTLTLGNLTLSDTLISHTGAATTTVVNNDAYAWTLATSTTAAPLFRIDTTMGAEAITLGQVGGDVYIGDIGSPSDLIFEESSTISGQGTNVVTLGTYGDIFNVQSFFGFSTSSPSHPLSIATSTVITGTVYDQNYSAGTDGFVMQTTGSGIEWVATSTLGINSSLFTDGGTDTYLSAIGDNILFGTSTNPGSAKFVLEQTGANDILNIIDDGSEVFTILDGGNVGVGSTSPWSKLSVEMDTTSPAFVVSNQGSTSPAFYIGDANQNGFVGIGTSNRPNTNDQLVLHGGSLFQSVAPTTGGGAGNQTGLRQVGSLAIGGSPESVFVSGRYAYVVDVASDDLKIIDVSDPSAPETVGTLVLGGVTTSPKSVFVSGRYAYVFDDIIDDFRVIDVSNPSAPEIVGTLGLGSSPESLFVSGRYAYVVDAASDDLKVIDVSDPSAPEIVSTLGLGGAPVSVFVSGRYAYVTDNSDNDLKVIDVSNPSAPVTVGTLGIGDIPHYLFVSGRYAYVIDTSSNDLKIIDVSNPSAPVTVGSVGIGDMPQSLFVSGRYAYVVDSDSDDLKVIDVGDPSAPEIAATLDIGTGPQSVFVSGRYAYVVDLGSDDLKVIDISGIEVQSALVHSLEAGSFQTRESAIIGNHLTVTGSLGVGIGGVRSDGAGTFTTFATTSPTDITALEGTIVDNNSSSVVDVLKLSHLASSTAANGIGSGLLFAAEYAHTDGRPTTTATSTAQIAGLLTDVTEASLSSALTFSTKQNSGDLVEAMRIDSNGNVGIGTTSPYQNLSISGNMALTGALFDNNATSGTSGYVLKSTGSGIEWVATSTLGLGGGSSLFTDGGTDTYLSAIGDNILFGTSTNPGSAKFVLEQTGANDILNIIDDGSEVFTILDGGNVGVGTSSPQYALHLYDDAASTFALQRSGANNIAVWDYSGSTFQFGTLGSDGFDIITDNNLRMRISAAGAVGYGYSSLGGLTEGDVVLSGTLGIGTANPQYTLEVNGSASTTNFYMPTTTSSTIGVFYKGDDPFLHNYKASYMDGSNTFVGENAGNFTMGSSTGGSVLGSYNTVVGGNAFVSNTEGYSNTVVGTDALQSNTTGRWNSAFGNLTMNSNTTGQNNSAYGEEALFQNLTGNDNTALGVVALFGNETGSGNTAVGHYAGFREFGLSDRHSVIDDNMVFLGKFASRDSSVASTTKLTNGIAIGYDAKVLASNQAVLGNDSITTTLLKGNVGIGSTTPSQVLTVAGNVAPSANLTHDLGTSGLRWNEAWVGTLNVGTSTWSIFNGSDGRLAVSDAASQGGTEHFSILTNGNVGIGDETPDHTLDVAGNIGIGAGGYLNFGDTDGDGGYGIRDNTGTIECKDSGGSWGSCGGDDLGDHTATQNIRLDGNRLSNDGDNEGIFVDTDGNVGIGTVGPHGLLHARTDGSGDKNIARFNYNLSNDVGTGIPGDSAVDHPGTVYIGGTKGTTLADVPRLSFMPNSFSSSAGHHLGEVYFNPWGNSSDHADHGSGIRGIQGSGHVKRNEVELFTSNENDETVAHLRIDHQGNVGIGNADPALRLHVGSTSVTDTTDLLRLEDANSSCDYDADSGSGSCTSDETLKTDIEVIDNELLTVTKLAPVFYRWKTESSTTTPHSGFIAQEVQDVLPELVSENEWKDGTMKLSLNTGGMMPYVVGAIGEQQMTLDELLSTGTSTMGTTSPFYHLFDGEVDTVWEKLVRLAKNFVDGVLTVAGIKTDELCIGDTCVNEAQLKQLLEDADTSDGTQTTNTGGGGTSNTDDSTNSGDGTDTGTTTSTTDTDTSTTTEPADTTDDTLGTSTPETDTATSSTEDSEGDDGSSETTDDPDPEPETQTNQTETEQGATTSTSENESTDDAESETETDPVQSSETTDASNDEEASADDTGATS